MFDEKFVAYIDILGFKKMVSNKIENEAKENLKNFYSSIYHLWMEKGFDVPETINGKKIYKVHGLAYSDSLTIYTKDAHPESLTKLLKFIKDLYLKSLFEYNILLRGGLAKGEFFDIGTIGFENLEKRPFYGQGFIDAYNLESRQGIKGCRFVIEKSLVESYGIHEVCQFEENTELFDFLWVDKKELTNEKLNIFYNIARRNKWLDHYKSTLDLFCLIAGIDKYDIIKQKFQNLKRDS